MFQSFALFPWLTVLQNVELGLEALGVDATERRKRALAAIDLIGLGAAAELAVDLSYNLEKQAY